MFKIKIFSEPGSSSFQKEQATHTAFCDILREMESKEIYFFMCILSVLLHFDTAMYTLN